MNCQKCGQIIENGEFCNLCLENSVRVLTKRERDSFRGETIDTGNPYEEQNDYNYSHKNTAFFSVKSFNLIPKSFIGKLILVIVIGLIIVISIPLFLLALFLGIISWFFFKRRY